MNRLKNENLQNIRSIFQDRTGVCFASANMRARRPRLNGALAAVAACLLLMTVSAVAISQFNSLSGDDLSLGAVYEGDGVVSIHVENRSDKTLRFEPKLKLMRWAGSVELPPFGAVSFQGVEFGPHTGGTMTLDLSGAYDIALLEQPLTDDHYYFVLTNNNFLFGQDWMCSVCFTEPVMAEPVRVEPLSPARADRVLTAQIEEGLQPYFQLRGGDSRENAAAYWEKCRELLSAVDGSVIFPVDSGPILDWPDADVTFDAAVPPEAQMQLTGENRLVLDAYGIPVGASDRDKALVMSAIVPQRKGQIDGAAIPVAYIFTYNASEIQSPGNYAFIRGRLITFEELEAWKVYADERYVCYDVTDLFYTDLHGHIDAICSLRPDVYLDRQVRTRVENIRDFVRDPKNLASGFHYLGE